MLWSFLALCQEPSDNRLKRAELSSLATPGSQAFQVWKGELLPASMNGLLNGELEYDPEKQTLSMTRPVRLHAPRRKTLICEASE